VLEPIFEADLPPEIYAYRPGRNAQQGWSRWKRWCSVVTRTSLTPTLRTTWIVIHTAPQLMKFD
jgi:hypothetical protein